MKTSHKIVVAFLLLLLAVGGAMAYKWERKKKQKAYLARLAEWKRQKTMPQPFKYKFITPDSLENRYLLLSPYKLYMWQHGRYMILDTKGNIYAEKYVPGLVNGFRQIKIGNTPYYTYMVNDTTVHHILKAGLVAGYAVLLDSALREVKKYRLLPHNDIVIDSNQGLDLHDFIIFNPEHYIVMAAYEKTVNNIPDTIPYHKRVKVVANILQEVDSGRVVWQWDATQFPELYAASVEHNQFTDTTKAQDYTHINAAFLDPTDSNLICSFRNADQILKISRKSGKILWRLGGLHSTFKIPEKYRFMRQHAPVKTLENASLLLLDNGEKYKRKTTRVLEFWLDEKHKTIKRIKETPLPDHFAQMMGNVEKVGHEYIVGGGSGCYAMGIDTGTGKITFEMNSNHPFYRVHIVKNIYGLEKNKRPPPVYSNTKK